METSSTALRARVDEVRGVFIIIRVAVQSHPVATVATLLLEVAQNVALPTVAVGFKLIVDGSLGDDHRLAALGVGIATGAISATWTLDTLASKVRIRLQERLSLTIDQDFMRRLASIPDIQIMDKAEYLDRVTALRANSELTGKAVGNMLQTVAVVVRLAYAAMLIALVNPAALAVVGAAAVSSAISWRAQRLAIQTEHDVAPRERHAEHVYKLLTEPSYLKEILILGTQSTLADQYQSELQEVRAQREGAARRVALQTFGGTLILGAGFALTALIGARMLDAGSASTGDVVLLLLVASQVMNYLSEASRRVALTQRLFRLSTDHYLWLRRSTATVVSAPESPRRVPASFVATGLTFAYDGAPNASLRDVNLQLDPGSLVVVVGHNGAGKSTFAKLLLGFYRPTEGSIRYGYNDVHCLASTWLWPRSSAVFQDYVRFETTLQESVELAALVSAVPCRSIDEALALAGIDERFPARRDEQLGARWPGGRDLSSGQWQRVALARALVRAEPELLVLDEPTASLDPEAEAAALTALFDSAKQRRSGGVAIIITHRIAATKEADLILVLDDGIVAQVGTFDELVAQKDGLYYELLSLHAAQYAS